MSIMLSSFCNNRLCIIRSRSSRAVPSTDSAPLSVSSASLSHRLWCCFYKRWLQSRLPSSPQTYWRYLPCVNCHFFNHIIEKWIVLYCPTAQSKEKKIEMADYVFWLIHFCIFYIHGSVYNCSPTCGGLNPLRVKSFSNFGEGYGSRPDILQENHTESAVTLKSPKVTAIFYRILVSRRQQTSG